MSSEAENLLLLAREMGLAVKHQREDGLIVSDESKPFGLYRFNPQHNEEQWGGLLVWAALSGYKPFLGHTFASCTTANMIVQEEKHDRTEQGLKKAFIEVLCRAIRRNDEQQAA